MITIDGSYGEGGGSIIRLALPLSYHTKKPVTIFNIRAKRRNPGLQTQHLIGIRLFHQLVGGKLEGDKKRSTKIVYYPPEDKKPLNTDLRTKIETAGNIGLVIQILQNTCFSLKQDFNVSITGGATHGKWAPTMEYLQEVTFPFLEHLGVKIKAKIEKYGFYPKGGAKVFIEFKPVLKKNSVLELLDENLEIKKVNIISIESLSLAQHRVAERQLKAAEKILSSKGIEISKTESMSVKTLSPGSSILVYSVIPGSYFIGTDNLGEKGVRAETIGEKPAKHFLELVDWKVTIDEYLSDQIILPAVFSGTKVKVRVPVFTKHAQTNAWLIEKFLPNTLIRFEKEDNGGLLIIN